MQKTTAGGKRAYAMAVVLAGMLVDFFTMSETLLAQIKLPKALTLTATGDVSRVTSSHQNHAKEQNLKCKSCHKPKIFQMKAGKTAQKKA